MSYTPQIKNKAIQLRRRGLSILVIADKLQIAKSTISLWVRDVPLPPELRDKLQQNFIDGRAKGSAIGKAKRAIVQENVTIATSLDITQLPKTKSFSRLVAALLYWCEGGKQNLSSGINFSNSDPALMKTFITALRQGFNLDESKFRVLLHLHEYHDEGKQQAFWSEVTGIPISQFQKTYLKPHTGKRKHLNYEGCASLRYYNAGIVKNLIILYSQFAKHSEGT